MERNLEHRIHLSRSRIRHLRQQVDRHFPEALVEGYEKFIPRMTNDPKDRHVVAAAVHCDADIIVTSNLRDFPSAALLHYDITAFHPDAFLLRLYRHSVAEVELRLCDQAKTIGRTLPELLRTLKIGVPRFDSEVGSAFGTDL